MFYLMAPDGSNALYPRGTTKKEIEKLLENNSLKGGNVIVEVKLVKTYGVVSHPLTLETLD